MISQEFLRNDFVKSVIHMDKLADEAGINRDTLRTHHTRANPPGSMTLKMAKKLMAAIGASEIKRRSRMSGEQLKQSKILNRKGLVRVAGLEPKVYNKINNGTKLTGQEQKALGAVITRVANMI